MCVESASTHKRAEMFAIKLFPFFVVLAIKLTFCVVGSFVLFLSFAREEEKNINE